MKKTAVTIIFVLGLVTTVSSQKKGDVEFGLNLGYNRANVSDSRQRSDSRSGYTFGGSIDYYFSNAWSIKGKLNYDQKGWDNGFIQDSQSGFQYPTNFTLNYLTVPVMASWHFGNDRNWYLQFGPYIGFLMDAKETRFGTDVKNNFNSTDFGFDFGVGVKIPVSKKIKVFFELDGQGGIDDIYQQNDYSAVLNSRTSINAGINFLLK